MADLAATCAGHTPNFADAVGRKIVVEHEAALLLAFIGFQALRVVARTEGFAVTSAWVSPRVKRAEP